MYSMNNEWANVTPQQFNEQHQDKRVSRKHILEETGSLVVDNGASGDAAAVFEINRTSVQSILKKHKYSKCV